MDEHTDARHKDQGDGMNMMGWDGMDGEKTAHRERNEWKEHSPLAWSNSLLGVGSGVMTSSPQLHVRNFKKHPAIPLKRLCTERYHLALVSSPLRLPAPGWEGAGSSMAPGVKGLWGVMCFPADLKHKQGSRGQNQ